MKCILTAAAIAARLLTGNAANAAAPESCHRTLTDAMTKDIGVETAQFIKTAYIPNQLRTVFDAQGSEREAVAKKTASVFAETVISATIDELEKKGMPPLSDECIHKVRSVVMAATAVVTPKLAQKLIAFVETDNHDEKAFEAASNELAIAWQQVTTIGVGGVVKP
jgi:hypothetical protein